MTIKGVIDVALQCECKIFINFNIIKENEITGSVAGEHSHRFFEPQNRLARGSPSESAGKMFLWPTLFVARPHHRDSVAPARPLCGWDW